MPVEAAPAHAPLLEMRGICKSFPGVIALDEVDFSVQAGSVHVLLGENGAGKSTLMKILSGAYLADRGEIRIDGRPTSIRGPADAHALGIRTIYQEFNLVPQLSAAENVFLGKEPVRAGPVLDQREMNRETTRLLRSIGVDFDPRTAVRELSVAQQQMVEVARALSAEARVLIMDEPTSALSAREIEELFVTIRDLRRRGVAIIYISHKLEELLTIGDQVTVLRDGRNAGSQPVAATSEAELIRMMAEREIAEHYPRRRTTPGDAVLDVRNLRTPSGVEDVTFTLHAGEIVGIAGLMGAGRTALAHAVFGAEPRSGGEIRVHGKPVQPDSPEMAISLGIGLLTEDRKNQGLVLGLPVAENISLPGLRSLSRFGMIDRKREREVAEQHVRDLRIKTPGIFERALNLSGGNQQKVVLSKWLACAADVLIFDEPTRGVDVAAKVEIYELMNGLTARGAGILMISSELPEILGMSDRILVMREGRLVAEFDADDASQERIMQAAIGAA